MKNNHNHGSLERTDLTDEYKKFPISRFLKSGAGDAARLSRRIDCGNGNIGCRTGDLLSSGRHPFAFGRSDQCGGRDVGTVTAIKVSTGQIEKTFQFEKRLHWLDISDDGRTLFISNKKEQRLTALDLKTDTRRVLPLSPAPYHLETIEGTGKVYVSSSSSPKIWVVDQKTAQLIGEIKISGEGHQMTTVQ